MTDIPLKDKNEEDFEKFETDDNKEEDPKKKKSKSKLLKPLIIAMAFLLIFTGILCYKYFHRPSNSLALSLALLKEYNELGKKDGNLILSFPMEVFLERRNNKYLNTELVFHFNKDDIDKERLLRAIKKVVENHGIFQSTFFKKDGKYHIKFDKNLYPEIIQKTIKESEYNNFVFEIEQQIDLPINNLMYKIYIIETEKSLYFIMFEHHAITDKMSVDALVNSLNKAYMNDTIPFKGEDLFYASLYEKNLKIRNDKKYINDVKNYFLNNYDLGRNFKNYHIDTDIPKPIKDTMSLHIERSSKSLRDKIHSIFNGKFSKISMFNLMCQLYTLYLYNNMEDHIPEIQYVRHGRNLKFYKNTIGAFLQIAFINYDISKHSIKIKDKKYLNVQEFYDNVKKQLDEQKLIDQYINTLGNYGLKNLDNLVTSQCYTMEEINNNQTMHIKLMPKYLFGKKLLENTKNDLVPIFNSKEYPFVKFFFQNAYTPDGIINQLQANGDCYKVESLKKISQLFFKVADSLSDGLLSDDKLMEIKMLN